VNITTETGTIKKDLILIAVVVLTILAAYYFLPSPYSWIVSMVVVMSSFSGRLQKRMGRKAIR